MPYTDMPPTPEPRGSWLAWGRALDINMRQAVQDMTALNSGVIHTKDATARPTGDPDVLVVWHTPEPPIQLMLPGDTWEPVL